MHEIQPRKTSEFHDWLLGLKDPRARIAIIKRLTRAINGNFGDSAGLSNGLSEMRVFVGKGYRIYYTIQNKQLVILLCGGHKGTQKKDIERAKKLLVELE
ncbi:type II toxin-antitoxin system RelE/ParE family toxin [Pseudidiomarina sediminum]|nr:type II toxin-antitoxin system RelE/ParE family toxin [Pseudidiomarina sediminum]